MPKLDNVLRKFDKNEKLMKIFIERCEFLDNENILLRKEVIRLMEVQRGLIAVIGEKTLKK